jgi:hypothetical protein
MHALETFVIEKKPSPKQAEKLFQYFQEIPTFFQKMSAFPLSTLNALQIGEWIAEIAQREQLEKSKVANQLIAANVFEKKGNVLEGIKHALKQMRFPEITRIEAELKNKVRELKLPRQVSVVFPKDLEGDKITFILATRSANELKEVAQALAAIPNPAIDELFSVL